ncbi:PREDICTED: protein RRNAD1-like isoform X2 [Ceratosolen solmsi marchali]|uniref:Protein RRNAD1-like isoform X2 n=1 Tax=Ceratosolen solmsi marchali TaxID=326594 RepID=A0AAJ6VKH5_9HYME|nr:PREDICTED: protein RRNAD1-like isoform X2 [Ceratosolen solmsi marchali]
MSYDEIEFQYFKEAILFLKEVKWIYDVPVTKIMVKNCLELMPIEWIETLIQLKYNELNNFVSKGKVKLSWPTSLINFVCKCKYLNKLPNPTIALSSIQLPKAFMKKISIKKQHEIFHLAQLVHKQCSLQNISIIVDLGAGLGHICQLLNYLFGYKVLGLESKLQNVETAKVRQKTLFPDSLSSVKFMCKEITINSAKKIELILQQEFKNTKNIGLMGLHACGDLSVVISKIYLEMNVAQLLILIPCCYHKLTLRNIKDKTNNSNKKEYFNNFPLSLTLKNAINNLNVDIGEIFKRPFMRLACQETSDRWLAMIEETHNKHSFYLLARAILELYDGLFLRKLVRKGTMKSQCLDFENYLKNCTQRYVYEKKFYCNETFISHAMPWNDEIKIDIISLWKNHAEKQKIVELYTALQSLLQQVIESLVLFDRLSFLKEYNYETNILSIMDKSLSPRCFAIVSTKKIHTHKCLKI